MALTRDLSVRERLADIPRDLEDTHRCFLGLLDLLLDGVVLGLERKDGSVALRQRVEVALCLLWCERDELGGHQVADGADVLFVFDSGQNAVVEF